MARFLQASSPTELSQLQALLVYTAQWLDPTEVPTPVFTNVFGEIETKAADFRRRAAIGVAGLPDPISDLESTSNGNGDPSEDFMERDSGEL